MPEIIEHGVTGFIAENEAEAIDVIGRIPTLDRRRVRAAFEQRFTARRMAECYRCCFEHLLAGGNARPPIMAHDRAAEGRARKRHTLPDMFQFAFVARLTARDR